MDEQGPLIWTLSGKAGVQNTVSDILVMHLYTYELVKVVLGYCQECLYKLHAIERDCNTIDTAFYIHRLLGRWSINTGEY